MGEFFCTAQGQRALNPALMNAGAGRWCDGKPDDRFTHGALRPENMFRYIYTTALSVNESEHRDASIEAAMPMGMVSLRGTCP